MFAPTPTPDATLHYRARAAERALPPGVERFLRMWGTEIWAAGAVQITLLRKDLPPRVRAAGPPDMEQVARPVLVGVTRRVDVDHDDVVELEALDVRDVGDIDAGLEVELVAAHPP